MFKEPTGFRDFLLVSVKKLGKESCFVMTYSIADFLLGEGLKNLTERGPFTYLGDYGFIFKLVLLPIEICASFVKNC